MVNQDNYFDLYDVLVNELAGDYLIFVFLSMAIIIYLSIRFNLPAAPLVLMCLLFLSVISMVTNTYSTFIWLIVVLVAGLLFYFILSRLFRRG